MSLAMRHKAKFAGQVAAKAQLPEQTGGNEISFASKVYVSEKFTSLRENLPNVLGMLKSLSGDEERNGYKAQLITQYRELALHIMDVCEDWGRQDVLALWLIWRMDVEGFMSVQADMFEGVLRGLTTPINYNRDWQSVYLTEMESYYTEAAKAGTVETTEPLDAVIECFSDGRITATPELKARIFKVYGHCLAETDPQTALNAYEKAELLDPKIGVKTRKDKIIKLLEGEGNE
jgi:hypothetical protein